MIKFLIPSRQVLPLPPWLLFNGSCLASQQAHSLPLSQSVALSAVRVCVSEGPLFFSLCYVFAQLTRCWSPMMSFTSSTNCQSGASFAHSMLRRTLSGLADEKSVEVM